MCKGSWAQNGTIGADIFVQRLVHQGPIKIIGTFMLISVQHGTD